MTHRGVLTAVAIAAALLAGSQTVQAQTRYDFKIPFEFTAQGKAFPAGEYTFQPTDTQEVLTLESAVAKSTATMMPVDCRISERKSLPNAELVFDVVNGHRYVSELLLPGEDGYLVLATKAKHTHQSVVGSRAAK